MVVIPVVAYVLTLPTDCVTRSGQDCNHDESTGWGTLGTVALTLEVLALLTLLVFVFALVAWGRAHARRRLEEDAH